MLELINRSDFNILGPTCEVQKGFYSGWTPSCSTTLSWCPEAWPGVATGEKLGRVVACSYRTRYSHRYAQTPTRLHHTSLLLSCTTLQTYGRMRWRVHDETCQRPTGLTGRCENHKWIMGQLSETGTGNMAVEEKAFCRLARRSSLSWIVTDVC